MTAAIELTGLCKQYGEFVAVDRLTLAVPKGSFFGFLGPNGAGKTTTINMLTGLATANSGEISVLGYRLPQDALTIRQQIGIVPGDALLFDYLTGLEYLSFTGRMYGLTRNVAEERGRELLALFELDGEPKKLSGEYSKGMRKRLAMSAALIHRPQLFLLDEPFEGVDAVGARLMKDILQRQVEHGATVFLTSHVLEVVESLCDRLAVIDHGRLLFESTMEEVRRSGESLEAQFVRLVGGERARSDALDWL